jgi:hypothetical protein
LGYSHLVIYIPTFRKDDDVNILGVQPTYFKAQTKVDAAKWMLSIDAMRVQLEERSAIHVAGKVFTPNNFEMSYASFRLRCCPIYFLKKILEMN